MTFKFSNKLGDSGMKFGSKLYSSQMNFGNKTGKHIVHHKMDMHEEEKEKHSDLEKYHHGDRLNSNHHRHG